MRSVLLHGIACPHDPELLPTVGRLRNLVGGFDHVVADTSGDEALLSEARGALPPGAALAEASAVRLRRQGAEVAWGEPIVLPSRREVVDLCEERGRSSVAIARSDPSLLTELQVGAWFDATWNVRLVRRLAVTGIRPPAHVDLRLAADAAFWRGVRSRASATEWTSWTRTSYVALVYHRLAGERKPGQERIDLAPEKFARQLRLLRRLGFRHLELEELLSLHEEQPGAPQLRRAYAVTLDDGLLDCFEPLLARRESGIQVFVSTAEVGGHAHWLGDEPLLGWDETRTLARAGITIGSHARHHRRLVGLEPHELDDELCGSRSDLGREVALPSTLAYPHGAHDEAVRTATIRAGYRAAFTTNKGRNGQGTDPYCLRRVSVHEADGPLAVLWKVATGEGLPELWLRARRLRQRFTTGRS